MSNFNGFLNPLSNLTEFKLLSKEYAKYVTKVRNSKYPLVLQVKILLAKNIFYKCQNV